MFDGVLDHRPRLTGSTEAVVERHTYTLHVVFFFPLTYRPSLLPG